jgi:hypothetical protein
MKSSGNGLHAQTLCIRNSINFTGKIVLRWTNEPIRQYKQFVSYESQSPSVIPRGGVEMTQHRKRKTKYPQETGLF